MTRQRQGGFTIAMALLYLLLLSAIFTSILHLVLTEQKQTRHHADYVQALYLAEGGIEWVLASMNGGDTEFAWEEWGRESSRKETQFDLSPHFNDTGWSQVTATFSNRTLYSTGRVQSPGVPSQVERTVIARVDVTDGVYTLSSWYEK